MTTFFPSGSIQTETITETGEYLITADGAQGGSGTDGGGTPSAGGMGAAIGGDVFLQAGTVLEIIVGGEGHAGSAAGGGGGGSFVIEINNGSEAVDTILAVAGGGGGAGVFGDGGPGLSGAHGGSGDGQSAGAGGAADSGGFSGHYSGGGGGGFTGGNGGAVNTAAQSGWAPGTGGHSGVPFHGGAGLTGGGAGGYGGGGGGGYLGGGGGGGWGGGGGGSGVAGEGPFGGGGGGSYFDGVATTDASGVQAGEGQVTVTFEGTVCFASGAHILTTGGEVAVEDLAVGDLALTASGQARPIVWIGHRRIQRPTHAQWPVRVMAGAFGDGRPARDLLLSPGHAVCVSVVGEVFVPIGELVNGATIAPLEVSEITYWHVELENHDVLVAEGLPCESYMDAGNRAFFGREHGWLEKIDPERAQASLAAYARPFVDDAAMIGLIRRRLAARAERLGWTKTAEMDLHFVVDGERVDGMIDEDVACFTFPSHAKAVRLASRTFSPSWDGQGEDHRELGVCVKSLRLGDGLSVNRQIQLDGLKGLHPEEAATSQAWRWTAGDLDLPHGLWAGCDRSVLLVVRLAPQTHAAWCAPATEREKEKRRAA